MNTKQEKSPETQQVDISVDQIDGCIELKREKERGKFNLQSCVRFKKVNISRISEYSFQ